MKTSLTFLVIALLIAVSASGQSPSSPTSFTNTPVANPTASFKFPILPPPGAGGGATMPPRIASPMTPTPTAPANPAATGSLTGEWLLGSDNSANAAASSATKLLIVATPAGLTIRSARGSYVYTRLTELPHVFKLTWSSRNANLDGTAFLVKVADDTLVDFDRGHTRRLHRVQTGFSNLRPALNPTGIWAKGPPNAPQFDVNAAATFKYETTESGLKVINMLGEVATWVKVPGQPNTYRGESVTHPFGKVITPPGMHDWTLTQVSQDRMVLKANNVTKHLVRMP